MTLEDYYQILTIHPQRTISKYLWGPYIEVIDISIRYRESITHHYRWDVIANETF